MRWIVAFIVVFVASVQGWMGVPRFVASLLKAPAHATVLAIEAGQSPPPTQLERAALYLEKARKWETSAQLDAALGFVRLLEAAHMDPTDAARGPAAHLAAETLRQSLRLSPARPHPWVRLAYARDLEGATGAEVARLLEQSTAVGGYVGEVALVRLRKLLQHWDTLPPDMRLYTFRQIRYIWANDQGFIFQAAQQTSKASIIRFALRTVPGAVDRFNRVVRPPSR